MIPGNRLSDVPMVGNFLEGDLISELRTDYELGGVALLDTSEGLDSYLWKGWVDGAEIFLAREPFTTPIKILDLTEGISKFTFCFNQNMNWQTAFQVASGIYFNWFDTAIADYTTTFYSGARSPALTLDDKRQISLSTSDVLFFYIQNDQLKYRQQRDRYGVEYILSDIEPGHNISRVGMNSVLRIQLEICGQEIPDPEPLNP